MRNRELLNHKVDQIDGQMRVLRNSIQKECTKREFVSQIETTEEIINEVKTIIGREPFEPHEMNQY